MMPLLKVSGLSVRYRSKKRETMAIDGVSFEIPESGFTVGLVGESGSGKTTLGMGIMNMIEKPGEITAGEVLYQGQDVLHKSEEELRSYRWQHVSMVYQSAMNSLNPLASARDHLVEVYREHGGLPMAKAREEAVQQLLDVGIGAERVRHFPHEFSGGMRQRVVIAMALALKPKLMIADEPTSALDVVVQKQILGLLKSEVIKNQLSLLFITHEIALLPGLVENVAVMYQGEVVEQGPLNKVLSDPEHPYTAMLLNSLLSMASTRDAIANKGTERWDSSREELPKACKYANRCKYAFERCRVERPKLLPTSPGRLVACHKYN
jgi:peptide/nickel transport system ATP-binding protein